MGCAGSRDEMGIRWVIFEDTLFARPLRSYLFGVERVVVLLA